MNSLIYSWRLSSRNIGFYNLKKNYFHVKYSMTSPSRLGLWCPILKSAGAVERPIHDFRLAAFDDPFGITDDLNWWLCRGDFSFGLVLFLNWTWGFKSWNIPCSEFRLDLVFARLFRTYLICTLFTLLGSYSIDSVVWLILYKSYSMSSGLTSDRQCFASSQLLCQPLCRSLLIWIGSILRFIHYMPVWPYIKYHILYYDT